MSEFYSKKRPTPLCLLHYQHIAKQAVYEEKEIHHYELKTNFTPEPTKNIYNLTLK